MSSKLSTFESKPLTRLFVEILRGNNYAQLLSKITGNQPSPIVIQLKRIEQEKYLISYQEDVNILNKTLYKPNWNKVIIDYLNSEALLPPNITKEDIKTVSSLFDNENIKELFSEDILKIFPEDFHFFEVLSLLITVITKRYDTITDRGIKQIFYSTGNAIANKHHKIVMEYQKAINDKINKNKELDQHLKEKYISLSKVILRTIKDYNKTLYFK